MVALVLGALLGYERESVGASVGLRAHMLVVLGSALFKVIPHQAGMQIDDVSRVLQGVIAGIWLTAAVGAAAGMGLEATAVVSAAFGWLVLAQLKKA